MVLNPDITSLKLASVDTYKQSGFVIIKSRIRNKNGIIYFVDKPRNTAHSLLNQVMLLLTNIFLMYIFTLK